MNEQNMELPDGFENLVRIFPLPNMVLFPGVIQALHLFEPRYREMMNHAMESDHLITMALVKPDPENATMPVPEIFQTVCIGKVITQAKLEDGRYNLLLAGVKRAKIIEELSTDMPYRNAKVELVDDFLSESEEEVGSLRAKVISTFRELTSVQKHIDADTLDQLIEQDVGLSQLVDLICYASGASPLAQHKALGMSDVGQRCRFVISLLEKLKLAVDVEVEGAKRDFPPDFSLN